MKKTFKNYYNMFVGSNLRIVMSILLNGYLFLGFINISFGSGNQNITINSSTTSTTGTWTVTGVAVPYSYTFQPNGSTNVANLNVADIVACLTGSNTTLGGGGTPLNTNNKAGNVTILTASTGSGAGVGDVTISQAISTTLSNSTQLSFTITAAGAIYVSNTISLKGNPGGAGIVGPGYPGVNVILNSGTGIAMTGGSGIVTDGGSGGGLGGAGASAGSITMTATTGNVSLGISSTAIGGTGGGMGGAGGAGGNVTLTAAAGVATLGNSLNSIGGSGMFGGAGGKGGNLTITGLTGAIISSSWNSYGGNAGATSGNGGNGGVLIMSALGGNAEVNSIVNNYGGNASVGSGGNGGSVTLTAFSSTITVACTSNGGNGGSAGNGGNGGALTMSAPSGTLTLSNSFNSNGGAAGMIGVGGNGGAWNLTALSTVTVSVACSSNGGAGGSSSGNGGEGGSMLFTSSASNVLMSNSLSSIGGNARAGNSSGGNGGSITIYSATSFSSSNGNGNDMSTKGGNATGSGSSGSGGNIIMTGNAANGGLSVGRTYTTSAGTGGSGTAGTAGTLTVSTGNSVVTSGGTNDGQSASGYPTISVGTAPLIKTGTGTFLLASTNNAYSGLTTVSAGTLKVGANNALGATTSGTTVSNGATIDINNTNYSTAEPLSITGNGVSSVGVMTTSTGGSGAWAGVVTIANGTSIGAAASSTLSISGQITGSGGLTKTDYGTLSLSSALNNYTGSTTVTAGTLQIGAAGVIPDASAIVLNGGTLRTNGAFSETMGTLTVNAGSFLTFGSASAHTLTFANSNALSWGAGANITVSGWTGTYGNTTSGTTKLIVGSAGNVLTAAQLARIQFIDASGAYWAAQALSTGEVVPAVLGNTFYAIANGNWDSNTTWSYAPAGAAVPSGVFPTSTKNVVISNYTVTLAAAAACNNITFGSSANGLTMGANNLTIFGNVNIVTACPTISTTGGNIVFDGTNNSSQTLTSTCSNVTLGNVNLSNGSNVSSNSSTTFSVANFTSAAGTTSWTNNGATTLTVTGALAAPATSFISNGSSSYTFNGATNTPITLGGLTSNSIGTINLGSKNTTISNLLSYTSGTITSTGIISMSANSVITAKNALTIANLQLGGGGVTSTGGGTLTATIFDFNGQASFTQTAGIITTSTINNNTGPISMAYSGTPTFVYSGSGIIPSGSYYNLTTTTNTKSVTCSSTITVDGVLTNSSGTITGPATSGQFGRFVNANPVNNIGGTIGSSSTNLAFSGTIQGGTVIGTGTNVLQNSSQAPSCTFYTISTASVSGYSYCQGSGPSASQAFTVSASGLTGSGNVLVTGSANYEVSSDNATFGASASYAFAGGIITGQPRTVYVRLKAGLATASYNSENVTVNAAGGASAKTVSNNGSVTNITVTPSVTASSSATTICAGTSITLTATPTNEGTTPTYQWSKEGTPISGATTATYTTSTAANNDSYTVTMTSNAACASPATVTSSAVVITVISAGTTITVNSSGTYTIPAGAKSVVIQVWGAGGGGSKGFSNLKGTGGGGGGFSQNNFSATAGDIISYTVGTGGTGATISGNGQNGGTTTATLNSNVTSASGGTGAQSTAVPDGTGGTGGAGLSNFNYSGGSGTVLVAPTSPSPGGGGGSSAGTISNGIAGSASSGGTAVTGGGAGGNGNANANGNGSPGSVPGGGGGGNAGNGNGGDGANGQVVITVYYTKISYSSLKFCKTVTSASPTIVGVTGGTFAAVPSGLSINATTGDINPSTSTAGNYTVNYSNSCGIISSTIVGITATVTPGVTASSSATTICAGASITLTATPTNGGTTPAYQWRKGGTPISGATNATYTTSAAANNDSYTVTMTSNATCPSPASATSSAVVITVNPLVTPSVTASSSATTICAGASITLTATPTNGGTTPAYQWRKGGTPISGATNATYTTSGAANNDSYTVTMTSNATCPSPASATSSAVVITVNPLVTPSVTASSSATTICAGASITLTATPTNGGTTPAYQWRKGGTPISGATNATYTTNAAANNDSYTVTMTSNATCPSPASATSSAVVITVNPLVTPGVTASSSATTICAGASITLTATPTNGGTTPAYQWRKGGTPISGATNATYTTNAAANNDSYTVTMTSNATCPSPASATSSAVVITVNPLVTPGVTASSSATTICTGASITLTATPANGGTTPAYQWSKDGTPISGATNATYTTNAAADNDIYRVTMTSSAACPSPSTVTSSPVIISVTAAPTGFAGTGITVCEGSGASNITAGASASNYSGISWSSSGTGTFAGNGSLTSTTYTPGTADATAGSITLSLTVTGTGACSGATAVSTKTVTITALPVITSTSPATRCGTGTVTLSATASAGTLDWYAASSGGSSLGTGASFITPAISATTIYYVAGTNLGCPGARTAVTATVDNACTYTWTGTTSTLWNVGSNWSTGNVPTSLNDVTIPSSVVSGNMPAISTNITVKTLSNTGTISLTGTGTLNVYGNVINSGTITTVAGSTISMAGSSAQTISGLTGIHNLSISNSAGVSLLSALTVNGSISLINGVLTTNNYLTLNFDAGGNIAYHVSDAGSISGNVSGTRNLVAKSHYISTPFVGVTSGQIDASTPIYRSANGAWLMASKKYNTQSWDFIKNYTTTLSPISGYSLGMFNAASLTMTGSYSHTASYSSGDYANTIPSSITKGMFFMVGNPYPSTLDWNSTTGWTKTNIDDAIYFWNPVTGSVSSYVNGVGTNGATQYIPAMQSFLVTVPGTGGMSSVLVNNNARVLTNASYFRTSPDQLVRLAVRNAAGTSVDETVVRLDDVSSADFESGADAYKIGGSLSLYTKNTGADTDYSINTLPLSGPELRVPLNLKVAGSNGLYTIECKEYSVAGYSLVLEDKQTQSYTLLNNSTIYTLTASSTDSVNRFVLRFVANLTTGVMTGSGVDLQISTYDNQMMLHAAGIRTENATINVYDASGLNVERFDNQRIASGIQTIGLPGLPSGVYIVKVEIEGVTYVGKVVLK